MHHDLENPTTNNIILPPMIHLLICLNNNNKKEEVIFLAQTMCVRVHAWQRISTTPSVLLWSLASLLAS